MNFDDAFKDLIGHEGGYIHHPRDPGGETKYGITRRSYPNEDIRGMTLDRAKAIYRRDFWDAVRGDEMPYPVAFNVFDGAVNSGVRTSARWLQQAVGTRPDGIIGPITMTAIHAAHPDRTVARYNGIRLQFMTDLSTWGDFGKGWARRIARNLTA